MHLRQRTLEAEEVAMIHSAIESLQELGEGFVREMWVHICENVATLRRAVMDRDPEMIAYWAHRCKGGIGQLGARHALNILHRLESMRRSRQIDGIEGVLAELGREMEMVEACLFNAEAATPQTTKAETKDVTEILRYGKYSPMSDLCSGG